MSVGMTAQRALAEDDQRTGQDVCAFDRDPDRRTGVDVGHDVARSAADAGAAEDIHAVDGEPAPPTRSSVLDQRRHHRWPVPCVDRAAGEDPRGLHQVGEAGDPGERLLDALEAADAETELPAHDTVGAGDSGDVFGGGGSSRRQRNRAAAGKRLHQHAPAMAGMFDAADDLRRRDHHAAPARRAVGEGAVHRIVPPADFDPGQRGVDQSAGDADVFALSQQVVGIEQPEGQTDQGGDRRQGDVALVPVESDHQLAARVAGTARRAPSSWRRRSRRWAR